MSQEQLNAQNIPSSDRAKNKSIYDVSGFEVFWRNFIAGMGRAIGGLFIYIVILGIIGSIINQFFVPKIRPLITTLRQSIEKLNEVQTLEETSPGPILNQSQIQEILKQADK